MVAPSIKDDMRRLFSDHAVFTKFVITDIIDELENVEADTTRLLRNQDDVGTLLSPIIGITKARDLVQLLKLHIELVGTYVSALKNRDPDISSTTKSELFTNSDAIGDFLTALSPDKLSIIKDMFRQNTQYVIDIADSQNKHQSDKVVRLFDTYYSHTRDISDLMASLG